MPLALVALGTTLALLGLSAEDAFAQAAAALDAADNANASGLRIELTGDTAEDSYVVGLKVMLLMVAMTFAPAIVLSMTSFTRIIVVLALLRQAVGVVQLPPTRVLVGLALFLTLFTMAPVMRQIDKVAVQPYQAGQLTEKEAMEAALDPARFSSVPVPSSIRKASHSRRTISPLTIVWPPEGGVFMVTRGVGWN